MQLRNKNITSRVILYSEVVRCDTVIRGNVTDAMVFTMWEPTHSLIGIVDLFLNNFTVVARKDTKVKLKLYCTIGLSISTKRYKYYIEFELAGKPTNAILHNISYNKFVGAYIGQLIDCRTDGWPASNLSSIMVIVSRNFIINDSFQTEVMPIVIPSTADLGFFHVRCNVTSWFDRLRPPMVFAEEYNIVLKSYIFFQWEFPTKNIYYSTEKLTCTFAAYITGILWVKQTGGHMKLSIRNASSIPLNMNYGGHFILYCYLEFLSNFLLYRKLHSFDVYKISTKACFQMFPRIRGSIVVCSHDGYPPDMSDVDIQIANTADNQLLATGGTMSEPYVRIPYVVYRRRITFICRITEKRNINKTVKHIIDTKLIESSNDVVTMSDQDAECTNFGEIPEQRDVVMLGEHKYRFFKAIVTMIESPSVWKITRKMLPTLLVVLTCFLYLHYRYKINTFKDESRRLTRQMINKRAKSLFARRRNDRLILASREYLTGDTKAIQDVFARDVMKSSRFETINITPMPEKISAKTPKSVKYANSVTSFSF